MAFKALANKRLFIFAVGRLALLLCLAPAWSATSSVAWAGAGGRTTLIVLGDSLVAGYGLDPSRSFPVRLQESLRAAGHDVSVVNAGVSGDTSAGGRERLAWSVPQDADAVIVELGANDALRGLDPVATRENLSAILARLRERGIAVLLVGMRAPPNMGPDYENAFNPIFPELAEEHGVPLYPFFLEGVAARPELNQADGMHPNAEGVEEMVRRFTPYAERLVEGIGGRAN